jgi:hypothetical protein
MQIHDFYNMEGFLFQGFNFHREAVCRATNHVVFDLLQIVFVARI